MSAKILPCAACDKRSPTNEMSKFPSNRDAALKWVKAFGIELEDYKPNSYVCHAHFDLKNDFIHFKDQFGNDKKKIMPSAQPKYNLPLVSLLVK